MVPFIREVMTHRVSTYLSPTDVPEAVIERGASLLAVIFATGCIDANDQPLYEPTIEVIQKMTDDLIALDGETFCTKYGILDLYKTRMQASRG